MMLFTMFYNSSLKDDKVRIQDNEIQSPGYSNE